MNSHWRDVTESYQKQTGESRKVLTVSDSCYISVLYRLNGLGNYHYESCVSIHGAKVAVFGDKTAELEHLSETALAHWMETALIISPDLSFWFGLEKCCCCGDVIWGAYAPEYGEPCINCESPTHLV